MSSGDALTLGVTCTQGYATVPPLESVIEVWRSRYEVGVYIEEELVHLLADPAIMHVRLAHHAVMSR